jgi:hypothetical protein
VRSIVLCLALLASVAACESTTDPFIGFGGTGATPGQVSGNWTFTLHPTTGCGTGSLADGQTMTAHFDVLTDGTVSSGTSTWLAGTASGSISGSINLNSGVTTPPLALTASTGSAMELAGTFSSSGSFSGTLSDPRAGSFPVFSSCSYTTTASKTS